MRLSTSKDSGECPTIAQFPLTAHMSISPDPLHRYAANRCVITPRVQNPGVRPGEPSRECGCQGALASALHG